MAAMSFYCCHSIAHFRYLFQKTTANPILDRGMITLLKPLHVTRIRVRAVHGNKSYRSNGSCEQSACESDILDLLNVSSEPTRTARNLSEKLAQIKTEAELKHLYTEILDSSHIKTMWEIARSGNNSGRVDPILPRDLLSPEKWIGMIWEENKQSIFRIFQRRQRLPLEGNLQMLICRGNLGIPGVIFLEKPGLLSVEWNPNDHPGGDVCDLAFKFGDGKQLLRHFPLDLIKPGSFYQDKIITDWNKALKDISAEKPWPLGDQFVVYLRCIGSNVLVGKAWKADGNPKKCGKLLFVKHPPQK